MSWGVISEMGYISVRTTDVSASHRDAIDLLGLCETRSGDGLSYLSARGDRHHELVYMASDHNAVERIALRARDGDSLREVQRRVAEQNMKIVELPDLAGMGETFAFVGPEGFVFELYHDIEAAGRSTVTGYGPDRYGHINLHPQDVVGFRRFLEQVLDFRASDVIGDDFAVFLRCNPDHHGIALIRGRGTLHHHAWQTQGVADIGRLADRLHDDERRMIWGPVRHGAGHNIAGYFVEHTGSVIELYADLEQIYDDNRSPGLWEEDSLWYSRWGVYRGEDFRSHGLLPTWGDAGAKDDRG